MAKTGETSKANIEVIQTSDLAGSESAALAESSSATPEAGEAANPPSPAQAAPVAPIPTTVELPATEAAATVDSVVTESAAV